MSNMLWHEGSWQLLWSEVGGWQMKLWNVFKYSQVFYWWTVMVPVAQCLGVLPWPPPLGCSHVFAILLLPLPQAQWLVILSFLSNSHVCVCVCCMWVQAHACMIHMWKSYDNFGGSRFSFWVPGMELRGQRSEIRLMQYMSLPVEPSHWPPLLPFKFIYIFWKGLTVSP